MTSGQFILWGLVALAAWGLFSTYRLISAGDVGAGENEMTPEQQHKLRVQAAAADAKPPVKVRIVDLDMPFGSLVMFMVKLALASIPAVIILALLFAGAASILSLL